jgi:hypothetical protein
VYSATAILLPVPSNIFVRRFKQARGPLPQDGSESFRSPHLGHLPQIGAPADAVNMGVHGIREAADQFHQTRFTGDGDTDLGEFLNEVGSARTERDLG